MLFLAKWLQINESIKTSWSDYFPALWYLWFYFEQLACPGQYFMRGGGAGDNLLVSYEPPRAGAVMLGSLAAQLRTGQAGPVSGLPRERERERERERPESILQLTTVTTSPASSAQQPLPATLTANSFSESEQKWRLGGFYDDFLGSMVRFKPVESLCAFTSNRSRL